MTQKFNDLTTNLIHVVGISGTECSAIALFLHQQGIPFIAHDFAEKKLFKHSFNANHFGYSPAKKEKMLEQIKQFKTINCQDNYLKDIEKAELIFVSQNWGDYSPNKKLKQIFQQNPDKFATITQLYFQIFPGKIIAITGTNGKSTTAKLIAEIMQLSSQVSDNINYENIKNIDTRESLVDKRVDTSRQRVDKKKLSSGQAVDKNRSEIRGQELEKMALKSCNNNEYLVIRVDKEVDTSRQTSRQRVDKKKLSSGQAVDKRVDISRQKNLKFDEILAKIRHNKLLSRQMSSRQLSRQNELSSGQRVDTSRQKKSNVYFTGNDRRNIQILDCLDKWTKNDWLVIEVSNRQLKFPLCRAPEIGVRPPALRP